MLLAAPKNDRYVAGLFLSFITWGWFLYSFGPSVGLLGAELGVSEAVAGLHGTIAVSTVVLVRHDGSRAPTMLAQANGAGSGIGILAPVAVGAAVAIGWGWRAAVLVSVFLAVVVALAVAPRVHSRPDEVHKNSGGGPTTAGRWFLVGVLAGVAMEFATTFWAVALVSELTTASTSIAALITAGFLVGMTSVRFGVAKLRRLASSEVLVAGGFATAIGGWTVVWLSHHVVVALIGLLVMGIGIGITYPLSVAGVLHHTQSEGHDRAQGWINVVSSIAVGVSPFALGGLADLFGMHMAFILVPALGLIGLVGVLQARAVTGDGGTL